MFCSRYRSASASVHQRAAVKYPFANGSSGPAIPEVLSSGGAMVHPCDWHARMKVSRIFSALAIALELTRTVHGSPATAYFIGARLACRSSLLKASRSPISPEYIAFPREVYRIIARSGARFDTWANSPPALRSLITNVLFSPSVDHGPRDTSLNSTKRQSVTSVSLSPR